MSFLAKIKKKGVKGSFYSIYIRYRKPVLKKYLRRFYDKHNGIPSDSEFLSRIKPTFFAGQKNLTGEQKSAFFTEYQEKKNSRVFLITQSEIPEIKRILLREFPGEVEETISKADDICDHKFNWLCPNAPVFSGKIQWHSNFEDDRIWPMDNYIDLDYSGEKRPGDVRQVWELNRHQYFVTLGKAYVLTGNEKYSKEFVDQLTDWIETNPVPYGINWLHSQETALRMQSWIWSYYFFRNSALFTKELKLLFFKMIYKHAEYTYWHLSRNPVTHNHLISEICGLIIFCFLFPEFKNSEKWFNEMMRIYNREIEKQIWEDGPSGELSTNYHLFVLDSLLIVKALLNKNGISLPLKTDNRIEKMIEYSMFMTRPDGTIPKFGDNDSGRAYRLVNLNPEDRRSYLSTGTVFYKRGDFKFVSSGFSVETLLLLGSNGFNIYNSVESREPDKKSSFFTGAGIGYFRNDWTEKSDYFAFRGGPTSLRNNVSTSHNHADFLSFEFYSKGKNIFIDPGTYLYGKDDRWRFYFRKTMAHNTVEIDGNDSLNVTASRFGVPEMYKSVLNNLICRDEFDFIDMTVLSYKGIGIQHRRKVIYYKTKFLLISDILYGEEKRKVKANFNCPQENISFGEKEVIIRTDETDGFRLIPVIENDFKISLSSGSYDPVDGWFAPRYGELQKINKLVIFAESDFPVVLSYIVVPLNMDFNMLNLSVNPEKQNFHFNLGGEIYQIESDRDVRIAKNSEWN